MGISNVNGAKSSAIPLYNLLAYNTLRQVPKGSLDTATRTQYATTVQWESFSVKADGSACRTSKMVRIEVSDDYPQNMGADKPKLVINAVKANYDIRKLIGGKTGEEALGPWEDAGPAQVKLYIKSVKIVDRTHGKIYALDLKGNWEELKGEHPVTAPDLTAGDFDLTGTARTYALPEAIWQNDPNDPRSADAEENKMEVSAIVEYGIDMSAVDKTAVKQYGLGFNPTVTHDPNLGIMDTYNKRVSWKAQTTGKGSEKKEWPAYHWDTVNDKPEGDRKEVAPYDPTLPYDAKNNKYYVILKKLAPISLESTLVY
jgi:hypothetical protein